MTPLEAIDYMYANMEEYADYGASDTEPRSVFQGILIDFWSTGEAEIPANAAGWQLFGNKRGVAAVAGILHDSAKLALEACNQDHKGFLFAMNYYYGGF